MAGRGYAIFDTGVGRCGIAWSDAGIVGVQLPEAREIAETLAWEEESVEKIIRRYVGRSAAIKARIKKLEARE